MTYSNTLAILPTSLYRGFTRLMYGRLNGPKQSFTLTYDRLALADGANPNIHKFEGVIQGNIFILHKISSTMLINSLIQQKNAGINDSEFIERSMDFFV